jgi:hypothetical protein
MGQIERSGNVGGAIPAYGSHPFAAGRRSSPSGKPGEVENSAGRNLSLPRWPAQNSTNWPEIVGKAYNRVTRWTNGSCVLMSKKITPDDLDFSQELDSLLLFKHILKLAHTLHRLVRTR